MSTEDTRAQKLQDVARLPSHQIWRRSKNPTDLTDLQNPSGPSATDLATTLPTDFSSDSTWTRLNLLVLAVCVTLWLPIMCLWHQHSERHNLRSHIGSCYCTTKAQQCRLWTQQLSADLWNPEVQKGDFFFFFSSWDSATLTPGLVEKIGSECQKLLMAGFPLQQVLQILDWIRVFTNQITKYLSFEHVASDQSLVDFVAKNWTGMSSK